MKQINRYLFILLAISLFFSLCILPVSAEEPAEETYFTWEASEDYSEISNEERTYYLVDLPVGYQWDFVDTYRYFNSVEDSDRIVWSITSYERRGEYLHTYLAPEPSYQIYATQKGLDSLHALIEEEEYSIVRFVHDGMYMDADAGFFEKLDAERAAAEKITVNVSELRYAAIYELYVFDALDQVYFKYGAIFEYNGGYWYVNYKELPNQYFDADGDFSFRRGSVELSRIGGESESVILDEEGSWYYRNGNYVYESDDVGPRVDLSKTFFFLAYVPVALLAPIPFIVLGLRNGKKTGKGSYRYWYLIAALAAAWLILGILVMVLLLI